MRIATAILLALLSVPALAQNAQESQSMVCRFGGEVIGAFGRGEGVDEVANGGPEPIDGPLGGLAQERL